MSDELLNFGPAIKSLYPKDYDEICNFAQSVLANASDVQVTFRENEFPQFIGKLNCIRKTSANAAGISSRGQTDLALGTNSNDPLAAQTRYQIGGGFFGYNREFRVVEIGEHKLIFLRWNSDGKTTRIFWNGKHVATVNRLAAFAVNFFGGDVEVQNPGGEILFIIHFRFALLLFSKRQILYDGRKILFPNAWPNPGGLPEKTVSDFANLPFGKQMIIIAVLLWADNSK